MLCALAALREIEERDRFAREERLLAMTDMHNAGASSSPQKPGFWSPSDGQCFMKKPGFLVFFAPLAALRENLGGKVYCREREIVGLVCWN
jgi:hypothetical protein